MFQSFEVVSICVLKSLLLWPLGIVRIEKKKRLKEMFDQEYDDKGEEKTLYDEMKEEMNQQAQVGGRCTEQSKARIPPIIPSTWIIP